AEAISMAINAIKLSGLEEFQIDIGQIDFFNGLMEESGLNQDQIHIIKDHIDNKDFIGIEEIIKEYNIKNGIKDLILDLPKMFGSTDLIEKAENLTRNKKSLNALKNLRDVLEILEDYGLSKYISVDLSLVPTDKDFNCYSGIIFKGFTYGIGFPILRGGRYDSLLSNFNDKRPATGFALGINLLMMALQMQKISSEKFKTDSLICYNRKGRKVAFMLADELRKQGLSIEVDISRNEIKYQKEYAKNSNIGGIVYVKNKEELEIHNLKTDEITKTSITDMLEKR
ncbi:MAG: ATP phosphoribosyltransferase regulatory subunit, partial [Clostridiales bacterium]